MNIHQKAAAAALFSGAQAGALRPETLQAYEEYAVSSPAEYLRLELDVLDRWCEVGERLGGWKIGLTARGARDSMGPGFRPFCYLLASRMFSSEEVVERSRISTCLIEPEIGIVMGASLSGHHVTREEAREAVAFVVPAFEIVERRLPPGMPDPIRIADALGQWGTVFGPTHPPDIDLASLTVELYNNEVLIHSGQSSPDFIDDPFLSLSRVCSSLADFGLSIEAGQRLITGSLTPAAPVEGPGIWSARFDGGLGEVKVNFV